MDFVYLNNAATSYPKPPEVIDATANALSMFPMESGRGGAVCKNTDACRTELASFFGVTDPKRICLTPGATHSINTVIHGLWKNKSDGHIVSTDLEHNSVLRPIEHLVESGKARADYIAPKPNGSLDPEEFEKTIDNDTRLIAVTHTSNVTGCVQPVEEIARIAAKSGVPLLIDAAQSAGSISLDIDGLPGEIYVAAAGHKGLCGPTGIGILILPGETLDQTIVGGTGIFSESRLHPTMLPLRHEAGTPNSVGIAGLLAGLRHVVKRGVEEIGSYKNNLVNNLRKELGELKGLELSPLYNSDGRAGIVSFVVSSMLSSEVGFALKESFGILTRDGLHCAPRAHGFWHSGPEGSVRVSVSEFNTEGDMERLIRALRVIVGN